MDEKVMIDTFTNNTAINTDSYRDSLQYIAGLPEGRIVTVTYFSQNAPITDIQSKASDLAMYTRDDVHIAWTEIRNFEIRCGQEFQYEYDEENNMSQVNGEGLTFPGFVPRIGDIFLYMMRNGQIGLFAITSIQRMALGQDTYHRITFNMQEFLTPTRRDQLRRQSTTTMYFDKKKFIVGNNAFMTTEGYQQQKELRHIRKELIQNYVDRFYDHSFSSFMRPDGVYDPYIVEYWNKKVSYSDCYDRPIQLLIAVSNFKKTIWSAMTNNPIKNLKNISRNSNTHTYAATFWGVNVTSLLGHPFLTVGDEAASEMDPLINDNGRSALYDTLPMFHSTQYESEKNALAEKAFDRFRHEVYGEHLPYRKCAPHQHDIHAHYCNPSQCKECAELPHDPHHPIKHHTPPYPIVSNEDLVAMWKALNRIPDTAILTEKQQAEARGYILWYRETYPGTLSRVELEAEWREAASIPSNAILTEAQEQAVQEYIKSYRSQFLPVLCDRHVEVLWRIQHGKGFEQKLEEKDILDILLFIKRYRDEHGQLPQDGFEHTCIEIGDPITPEEVEAAGALMYDDVFVMEMSLSDLVSISHDPSNPDTEETPPGPGQDSIKPVPDHVPVVFRPQHPRAHHHIHCHDACHHECGRRPETSTSEETEYGDSYGLSAEFYLGSTAMSTFERLVYDAITGGEIDPGAVLTVVSEYLSWEDSDAFYQHLFALYLIDKSLFWLRFHS